MNRSNYQSLDLREHEVRATINTIKAMGLDCTRTNRTGEYRIEKRARGCVTLRYAKTPTQAIATAKRLLIERH